MQRKDLALRVLSTAAIMSIVTSIAAPAFAGTYYLGDFTESEFKVEVDTEGKVKVNGVEDTTEVVIRGGKEADYAATGNAEGSSATAATQELEAAGLEDAAGEGQPDPDAGFTLNETEEDSAQTQQGKDNTKEEDTPDPSTEPPKKDVVYEYAPADPEPEKPTTKLTPTTSAAPAAKTSEATLADAPAPTTPAAGSVTTPTTSVIKVINNWVGEAAKEFKIRLSNVNIKPSYGQAAMDVSGGGTTKVELDGQNVLDSSESCRAGLRKQGEGTLIITDETDDNGNKITAPKSESDTSGSLTAKGGGSNGSAGIGGNIGESTKNITIEGYATVNATGGGSGGAGIGGGGGGGQSGDAENIIIQGHSKVTASADNGAAIGGGSNGSYWGSHSGYWGGSAKGIVIRDHATVVAKCHGIVGSGAFGAAIGAAGYSGDFTEAEVIIGTPGATAEKEDVNIIATGLAGSAIGNGGTTTNVTIQGHVNIHTASSNSIAIGSKYGNVKVNINDNASIDTATGAGASSIGGGYIDSSLGRTVEVNIDGGADGNVRLGEESAIYGAISGTTVNIGDNVLIKMKQAGSTNGKYISVNNAEAEVGKRSDPTAGGLVNTIGNNTQLWYTDINGVLQKIVHSKNLCKKELVDETHATCTTPGSKTYECTFEKDNNAVDPEHKDQWVENTPATGHTWTDNGSDSTHICTKDNVTEAHSYSAWTADTATCTAGGIQTRTCSVCGHVETKVTPALGHQWHSDNDATHTCNRDNVTEAHSYDEWTTVTPATCTTAGEKKHTCTECGHVETEVIPATGHHWKDNGDGTHTCPDCGATEGQPFNTNSALELRVVDAEGMDQPFTVSQNGTLRTYTGAYDIATLTGDLDTLRYLQDHGAQTIQFVTNGQTSSFAINDLLAQGSGSEVFYLTHRGAEEPTLLLVEADHSELVKD